METSTNDICPRCSKKSDTTIFSSDGQSEKLCKVCAIKSILKHMTVVSILPILLFVLLIVIGINLVGSQPIIFRYFLIWLIVGLPYGLKYAFNIIHIGITIPTMIGVIMINLFIAGLIGGFVAVGRICKAIADSVKSILLIKYIIN